MLITANNSQKHKKNRIVWNECKWYEIKRKLWHTQQERAMIKYTENNTQPSRKRLVWIFNSISSLPWFKNDFSHFSLVFNSSLVLLFFLLFFIFLTFIVTHCNWNIVFVFPVYIFVLVKHIHRNPSFEFVYHSSSTKFKWFLFLNNICAQCINIRIKLSILMNNINHTSNSNLM